jgi:hypothetical protein
MDVLFSILFLVGTGLLGLILAFVKRRMLSGFTASHIIIGLAVLLIANYSAPLIDYYIFDFRFLAVLYFSVIYLGEILFIDESQVSFVKRLEQMKANSALFDAMFALKHRDLKNAYNYIEKGLALRPNDPLLLSLKKRILRAKEPIPQQKMLKTEWIVNPKHLSNLILKVRTYKRKLFH